MYPVVFQPVVKERIWGGHQLKTMFGVETDRPIGEYWTLADHPAGSSTVRNGRLLGRTLTEIVQDHPEDYLGRTRAKHFPLMVKFLEAESNLSVQVHPGDDYASRHGGDNGKTEAWYVLRALPGAKVNVGHRFANPDVFRQAIREGRLEDGLEFLHIHSGDVIYVPSGTLHALLEGTQVIEVQQSSDVTYRVYDWNRVDEHGNSRDLHVDDALAVLRFPENDGNDVNSDHAAAWQQNGARLIYSGPGVVHERKVDGEHFCLDTLSLREAGWKRLREGGTSPEILILAEGACRLTANSLDVEEFSAEERVLDLVPGDTVLVPATMSSYHLQTPSHAQFVLATYPTTQRG